MDPHMPLYAPTSARAFTIAVKPPTGRLWITPEPGGFCLVYTNGWRPRWVHRWAMRLLLGWVWQDEPTAGVSKS